MMMDHVYLLRQGRCLYNGAPGGVADYFKKRGYPMPLGYNAADWMLNVSQQANSAEELEDKGFYGEYDAAEGDKFKRYSQALPGSRHKERRVMSIYESMTSSKRPESLFQQLFTHSTFPTTAWQLARREALNVVRNKTVLMIRVFGLLVGSVSCGVVLFNIGQRPIEDPEGFISLVGVLFLCLAVTSLPMMVVMMDMIEVIPIFEKEYGTGHYGVWTFSLVRFGFEIVTCLLASLVFLSIVFNTVKLDGRYLYLYATQMTLGLVLSTFGGLLTCIYKNPKHAKELLQVVVCKNPHPNCAVQASRLYTLAEF
jgi:hypothetical protein